MLRLYVADYIQHDDLPSTSILDHFRFILTGTHSDAAVAGDRCQLQSDAAKCALHLPIPQLSMTMMPVMAAAHAAFRQHFMTSAARRFCCRRRLSAAQTSTSKSRFAVSRRPHTRGFYFIIARGHSQVAGLRIWMRFWWRYKDIKWMGDVDGPSAQHTRHRCCRHDID